MSDKVTRDEVMARYRQAIESGDPMDTIIIAMSHDPDVEAAALIYRAAKTLRELNERHDDDPHNMVHAGLGREKRGAEVEMLDGLYEGLLDRAVTETVHIINDCRCSMCQAQSAHLN